MDDGAGVRRKSPRVNRKRPTDRQRIAVLERVVKRLKKELEAVSDRAYNHRHYDYGEIP